MKRSHAFLGIIISLLFLFLAFHNSDFGQILEQMRGLEAWPLFLGLPILYAAYGVRVIRWRYLLLPLAKVRYHALFSSIMIGFMSLNILPFRLGEFTFKVGA